VDTTDPSTDLQSFANWLRRHRQSRAAVGTLWELVGIATLNARAEESSLALAATVFQVGLLGDNASGDLGWALVPLQRLHGDAATAVLARSGARVTRRTPVWWLRSTRAGWLVGARTGNDSFDAVVLAVPPPAAERLLPAGATALPPGWAAALGNSPIVNLHLVLDRTVLGEPLVAAVDSDVQWVFDRTRQAGLACGQYLAVSLSAAHDWIDVPSAALRHHFLPALGSVLPGLAAADLRDFFVTRERAATFRPSPGSAALRPGPRTAAGGLYLAGAWTATGWPATMESAVRSGDAAAAALLEDISTTSTEAA